MYYLEVVASYTLMSTRSLRRRCLTSAGSSEAKVAAAAAAELLDSDEGPISALIPAVHADGTSARGLNDDNSLVQDHEYFDKFFLRYNKVRRFPLTELAATTCLVVPGTIMMHIHHVVLVSGPAHIIRAASACLLPFSSGRERVADNFTSTESISLPSTERTCSPKSACACSVVHGVMP